MRLRVRFSKQGKVRFTSHRDLARIWERAIRRVGLPVAYSQGFSPRPKLHFGLAIPTGAESWAEYLDIDLAPDAPPVDLATLPVLLDGALPIGISPTAVAEVPPGTTSLQEAVGSATWSIMVTGGDIGALQVAIDRLLAAPELLTTRQRKGHDVTDDIRPYILDLAVVGPRPDGLQVEAELGTRPRGLRPSELVVALGDPFREGRICRTHQWMELDGARQEPLPDPAMPAPYARSRP